MRTHTHTHILVPQVINATYKTNLLSLKNMLLVMFTKDTMVTPRESEWFGFYAPGQASVILPMNQTQLYLEVCARTRTAGRP